MATVLDTVLITGASSGIGFDVARRYFWTKVPMLS